VQQGAPPAAAVQLEHVIVLVLENRSFDHLFGYLDHPSSEFDGLTGRPDLGNHLDPRRSSSPWYRPEPTTEYFLPVDPDHEHRAVLGQIEQVGGVRNAGFAHSYMHKVLETETQANRRRLLRAWSLRLIIAAVAAVVVLAALQLWWWTIVPAIVALGGLVLGMAMRPKPVTPNEQHAADGRARLVMRGLASEAVPVLSTLAREFGVCQRWFSSVPGETWPNRNFFHAGSSSGAVNIELGFYRERTIFQALDKAGRRWKVYYGQFPPEVFCFPYVLERSIECSGRLKDLFDDLEHGTLPTYAFVEPHHGLLGKRPSCSQHPGNNLADKHDASDFRAGERLIGEIYQRLRENEELFKKTMFVIAYDEHGGLYDHCRPPAATAVRARHDTWSRRLLRWLSARRFPSGFGFRRLGPRIPCVVISPWIAPHTLDSRDRDHTSIPRTLRKLFAPRSRALSRREVKAPTIETLLTRSTPRTGPALPDLGPAMAQLGTPPLFEEEQTDAAPEAPRSGFEWRLLYLTHGIKQGTIDKPKRRMRIPRRMPRRFRREAAPPLRTPKRRRVGPRARQRLRKMNPQELVELYDATEFYLGALAAERLRRDN
jgi:phospholipase C